MSDELYSLEEINSQQEVKKIYQILTGKSEEEYYTFDAPTFSDDYLALKCTNVVLKEGVEQIVINKKITVHYASDLKEEETFLLDDGVVIKSLDSEKLIWLHKTKEQAEEALKDRELEVYREMLPKLLNKQQMAQQFQQQPSYGNGKNLFIE